MTTLPPEANAVLTFWFADALDSPEAAQAVSKRWFTQDPAFDAAIAQRFGHLPDAALRGELDDWAGTPQGALARIVVLDQFPRNLHRESARAFAFDAYAAAAAQAAVAAGFDAQLAPLEAVFVYLPFEHAEDPALQARSVSLFTALDRRAPPGCEPLFANFLDFARRHRDVIARFGRFPHRNAVLGRVPTAEEIGWLAAGGERFGAKPAGPARH